MSSLLWLGLVAGAHAQSWNSLGPPGGSVLSVVASPRAPTVLYAGTARNGVFMSADGGQTWAAANSGLTPTTNSAWRTVRALAADAQYVYAATDKGLFYAAAGASAGELPSWAPVAGPAGLSGTLSLLLVDMPSMTLFAASSSVSLAAAPSLYAMPLPAAAATPSGTWVASPLPADTAGSAIGAMAAVPGLAVVAGVSDRVFAASLVSATTPLQWLDADTQLQIRPTGVVEALHYSADFAQLYACSGGQLLQATNVADPPSNAWNALSVSPAPATTFNCAGMASGGLAFGAPSVLALATSAGVYLSSNGTSFAPAQGLGVSRAANAVAITGGLSPTLFVGAGFGMASQALASVAPTGAWSSANGPATVSAGGGNGRLNNANTNDVVRVGTTLYAAVAAEQYADVLASSDDGATWSSTGLTSVLPDLVEVSVLAADATNRVVYAGTGVGLYALAGGTWVQLAGSTITEVASLHVVGSTLFIGTDNGLYSLALSATPSSGVPSAAGLAGLRVSALHAAGSNLYAGVFDVNAGSASVAVASTAALPPSWSNFATGNVGTHRIYSLLWTGSQLLAASRGELVSAALPGGGWASAGAGLADPNGVARALATDGATIYVATESNGVFASPINVIAWSPYSGSGADALPSLEVHGLRVDGAALYAATAAGVAAINVSPTSVPVAGPGNSSAETSSGGGGAIDIGSLLGLLAVTAMLFGVRSPRRKARGD
ncbi:MAG: hypothetical protein U1E89_18500 [Burkholderiaceae bacterium]